MITTFALLILIDLSHLPVFSTRMMNGRLPFFIAVVLIDLLYGTTAFAATVTSDFSFKVRLVWFLLVHQTVFCILLAGFSALVRFVGLSRLPSLTERHRVELDALLRLIGNSGIRDFLWLQKLGLHGLFHG